VCMVTLVHSERTVRTQVTRPRRGVQVHWYTMSKHSGNEFKTLHGGAQYLLSHRAAATHARFAPQHSVRR
jgi:hypothetical protein